MKHIPNLAETQGTNVISEPPTPHRSLPLRSAEQVRQELSRLYRQARTGEIEPAIACKLAWILGQLVKAIEVSLAEEKLTELEALITTQRAKAIR